MSLSPQCQAILLLTVHLGREATQVERPLSTAEWARFAHWLQAHEIEPAQLLGNKVETLLNGWKDPRVSFSRLKRLLGQGMALGLAAEKWERAGLWILTRSHSEYPVRLKNKLGTDAPPVLIGCGSKKLLDRGGVAVVGSRNAHNEGLSYTRQLAKAVSEFGKSIISGGARGVDITAMEATLEADGTCVGVLADSLMKAAASRRFRKYILNNSLALITSFNPEAGFNVGNAMARNRYIYCLSDLAVVVDSTKRKGGTWSGAEQNLKCKWVPVFAKPNEHPRSGNTALLELGARRATLDIQKLYEQVTEFDCKQATPKAAGKMKPKAEAQHLFPDVKQEEALKPIGSEKPFASSSVEGSRAIFDYALSVIESALMDRELEVHQVAFRLELEKAQAKAWLERAAGEGRIMKYARSASFRNIPAINQQGQGNSGTSNAVFDLILPFIKAELADKELRAEDVALRLGLEKAQAKAWLEKAAREEHIAKQNQPVRFGNIPAASQQGQGNSGTSNAVFNSVLSLLKTALADKKMKADEIALMLGLEKAQAKAWLKRATDEGRIAKHGRPIRFGNIPVPSQQSLFDETNLQADSAQ